MNTKNLLIFITFLVCSVTSYADFREGGNAYIRGDYEAAVAEFIPLAERGDHRAMYALGSMYAEGHGVEKDLKRAFELFTEAAQNGREDAMYKLGLMYEEGLGVKQNLRKAARWYNKSSKKGYPLSQYRFGMMYLNGKGLKKNITTAYAWLVVAGQYFIYETQTTDPVEIRENSPEEKQEILLFHYEEKEKILDEIIKNLQGIKGKLNESDINLIRNKVIKFRQYRTGKIVNSTANGSIENLFLPETLQ